MTNELNLNKLKQIINKNEGLKFYYCGEFYKINHGEIKNINGELPYWNNIENLYDNEIKDLIININKFAKYDSEMIDEILKIDTMELEKQELEEVLKQYEGCYFKFGASLGIIYKNTIYFSFSIVNDKVYPYVFDVDDYIDKNAEFDLERDIHEYIQAIRYHRVVPKIDFKEVK